MPTANLNANILTAPGVHVAENQAGFAPVEISTFNRAYIVGSGSTGDYADPRQVTDITDAINQFGILPASVNARSIKMFFTNYRQGVLFFVRAPIGALWTVTIAGTPVAGDDITVTLDPLGTPVPVTYLVTTEAAADMQVLLDELIDAINNDAGIAAISIAERPDAISGTFNLRLLDPTTVAASTYVDAVAGVGAGVTAAIAFPSAAALHPSRHDFLWTLAEAFDPEIDEAGFLAAPEAFKYLTDQGDRVAVGQALHDVAAGSGFDWFAFIDSGPPAEIPDPTAAQTEGLLFSAPFGHAAYYYPYLIDFHSDEIPPSMAVAAIALKRFSLEGFQQPPAGPKYPIAGVTDVKYRVKTQVHHVINPDGINAVIYKPNNGILIYGARTRSANPFYRFVHTRVILNVLIRTIRAAFQANTFEAIDGEGVFFMQLRQAATAIGYRFWQGGAIFGASLDEAFRVKIDRENNPDLDLEAGVVNMDIFVVPSPTSERIFATVNRVAIGQISSAARGL